MVKMICFRFNLDNPEHAKAWAICTALIRIK